MGNQANQVCIIGAGPAGLAAARALRSKGISYRHFDAGSQVGGIWDINRPGTPMYDNAHFISSKTLSGFADFPMPESYPDYPRHDQIQSYICDFAKTHGLDEAIEFNTAVSDIEKQEDGQWKVTLEGGQSSNYFGVICATGTQWHPKLPEFKGSFSGEIMHSQAYRSPDFFKGKRVLIVGAGNSGCDIACDAAANADKAFISMRRGYYFIPKHIFGKPADVFDHDSPSLPLWISRPITTMLLNWYVGDLTKFGLKKPDHKLFESHPILNSQLLHYLQHGDIHAMDDIKELDGDDVVFKDGSRETIDLIVCATGYHQPQGFARDYFKYHGGRPNMYLQIFNREHRNLFGISHIETNSGAFKMFDQMAFVLANYIKDQFDGSKRVDAIERMIANDTPDLTNGIKFVDSDRHKGYVDSDAYKAFLTKLCKKIGWNRLSEENLQPKAPALSQELPIEKAA